MKKVWLLASFATAIILGGCGSGETKDSSSTTATEEKKEEGKFDPSKKELKETTSEKTGATILVPDGAKVLRENETSWTTSLLYPDGLFEVNIDVSESAPTIKTLADAESWATLTGTKGIKDKQQVGDDFLIVKEAQGALIDVYYFAKGKTRNVRALVSAPKDQEALLIKIAKSLKSNK